MNSIRYCFLCFPDGKKKAVTISYDDSCIYNIKLAQLFDKYKLKSTFNINSDFLAEKSGGWHITLDEVREHLLNKGHEIAVHGARHRANGKIRIIDGIQDVLNCRFKLENELGVIIRGMAYPDSGINDFQNGKSYDSVRQYLIDLDIAYARTAGVSDQSFRIPEDWYCWMPNCHHNHPEVFGLIDRFLNVDTDCSYLANRYSRIFYLWGHSYEFEEDNNWDHAEKICKALSQKNEIWYATNIEIVDYINAYRSLIFSADGTIVYNPTLFHIWFEVDGIMHDIKSGETKNI